MLEKGIKNKKEIIVTKDMTAASIGNEGVEVFSTPEMLSFIEMTCKESIDPYLEEGQGTVGMEVNLQHLGATPVGMKVVCESELVEVDRKKLTFKVTCQDEEELVGKATHTRFIIDEEAFFTKFREKAARIKRD